MALPRVGVGPVRDVLGRDEHEVALMVDLAGQEPSRWLAGVMPTRRSGEEDESPRDTPDRVPGSTLTYLRPACYGAWEGGVDDAGRPPTAGSPWT
jgi:hypothetical protein